MMASDICPCCGQVLPDAEIPLADRARLSPTERKAFNAIAGAHGAAVSSGALIDVLYGDDAEGGALTAPQVLRAIIMRSNRKLSPLGRRIVNVRGRGYMLTADRLGQ